MERHDRARLRNPTITWTVYEIIAYWSRSFFVFCLFVDFCFFFFFLVKDGGHSVYSPPFLSLQAAWRRSELRGNFLDNFLFCAELRGM